MKLNETQKIVLDWLKKSHTNDINTAFGLIADLAGCIAPENVCKAFISLDEKQGFEVLDEFTKWGLEND